MIGQTEVYYLEFKVVLIEFLPLTDQTPPIALTGLTAILSIEPYNLQATDGTESLHLFESYYIGCYIDFY